MKKKKSLAEYLLEWAAEREGPLVRRMMRRPLLGRLFEMKKIQVLNRDECVGSFRNDLMKAEDMVLIYSPFVNSVDIERFMNMAELRDALKRGVKVNVVTRPPEKKVSSSLRKLSEMGVEVYVREGFHEKVIIIDGRIAYVGSANILAWPSGSDLMQRVEDPDTVKELLMKIALPKEEEILNK